jgi:uncharacterized MAPEG superfamily protein
VSERGTARNHHRAGPALECNYFAYQVGTGRAKFNVPAPAMSGDPTWDRMYRVQLNTLEQLAIFLPRLWIFAYFISAPVAAGIGFIFLMVRLVYASNYVADPDKRTPGFVAGFLCNAVLVLGGLVGAVIAL